MSQFVVRGTHAQDIPGAGFALPGATVDLDDEVGEAYVAAGIVRVAPTSTKKTAKTEAAS